MAMVIYFTTLYVEVQLLVKSGILSVIYSFSSGYLTLNNIYQLYNTVGTTINSNIVFDSFSFLIIFFIFF